MLFGVGISCRILYSTNSYLYILNAKKTAPGKQIKIYEKNGNFKV